MIRIISVILPVFLGLAGLSSDAGAAGSGKERDPVVGEWRVEPAVSTDSGSCTITFSPIAIGKTGRASPFACHHVIGLGGLHGFADISKWERKGDQIIFSGIARAGLGTVNLPSGSNAKRVGGALKDGIRFTLVRK